MYMILASSAHAHDDQSLFKMVIGGLDKTGITKVCSIDSKAFSNKSMKSVVKLAIKASKAEFGKTEVYKKPQVPSVEFYAYIPQDDAQWKEVKLRVNSSHGSSRKNTYTDDQLVEFIKSKCGEK